MKIERTKNAVRNMAWGYVYKMINIIFPFVFRTVMIKVLGAEYLGVNSLFTSILQVLSLSELGFGYAMVFSMYKPIAENDDEMICALLNLYKKIYFIIGCIILGLGLALAPFIQYLISGDYPSDINIYFVYVMFLLNTSISYFLFAYRGSLLSAFQRNDVESKILSVVTIFRYTVEIVGILITKQYYLFLFAELAATVLTNIIKLRATNRMYPEYKARGSVDADKKKEIKSNVMALMCHKIGGIILNSADNIVLSAFMGVVIVANYANYYYIMNAITGIVIICFTGLTAGIGNSFVVESVEKNRDNFKKILFFNAWLVSWCSVCFICLYQDFMELWVGKEYMFSDFIMILVVVYFFAHCIRRTINVFRDGAGMWVDNKWQPIVSATFNLIVNIILVNIIGVAGILISSILSMVMIDIPWEAKAFCKRIEMKNSEYLLLLVKYFAITALISGILYVGTGYIHLGLVANLLIKGCICVVIPNLFFWLVYRRRPEFGYFVGLIKRMTSKVIR